MVTYVGDVDLEEVVGGAWNQVSKERFEGMLPSMQKQNILVLVGASHVPVFED